jgi:hypothetical protein
MWLHKYFVSHAWECNTAVVGGVVVMGLEGPKWGCWSSRISSAKRQCGRWSAGEDKKRQDQGIVTENKLYFVCLFFLNFEVTFISVLIHRCR